VTASLRVLIPPAAVAAQRPFEEMGLFREDSMSIRIAPAILAAAVSVACGFAPANAQQAQPPQSLRLYVLDCGIITPPNLDTYGFKMSDVADSRMVTPCFLIAHPRGSLMWDTGEIPDSAFKDGVSPQKLNNFTVDRPLLPQLAAIGYTPSNITYMALSHYHGDHVANASLFAGSTWIVQKGDRDVILGPRPAVRAPGGAPDPKFFEGLDKSKTILLNGEDHDVFGDGSVMIKYAPGHTPGHQALFLKLAKTGNVLLSGDLYHYREEIAQKKVPGFDFNKEQTFKSRAMIEDFVKQNNAQLWIQHEYLPGIKRKLAPEFYD
jgi:glyoxylase-like metal-dependent hydrolase (beta-lactamase superfamily II)